MPDKKKKTAKKAPENKIKNSKRSSAKSKPSRARKVKSSGYKSSYETWLDDQVSKRSRRPINVGTTVNKTTMPVNTFGAWLAKQTIVVKEDKPISGGVVATYEYWLRKQVEENRFDSEHQQESVQTPSGEGSSQAA